MAYPGDSVDLAYPTLNTRRGRVGRKIAHTITTGSSQGTLCCVDMNEEPELTDYARCLTAKQNGGIRSHKREASGVWDGCRIRRLTPRECLRLQGWTDERIDLVLPLQSDAQLRCSIAAHWSGAVLRAPSMPVRCAPILRWRWLSPPRPSIRSGR